MTGMTDYIAQAFNNYIVGAAAMPALPASEWLALFTAVGTDAGTGFTEVSASGTAYARVQVAGSATTNATTASGNATLHFASTPAWIVAGMSVTDTTAPSVIPANTTVLSVTGTTVVMSANATGGGVGGTDAIRFTAFSPSAGSAPSSVVNNAIIGFAAATGAGFGTVIAFGLYDANTSGNLLSWDFMGNFSWQPWEVSSVGSGNGGVFAQHAHAYANGDPVVVTAEYGGTLPTVTQGALATYTLNFAANVATDSYTLSSSSSAPSSGNAVWTSATGNGMARKVTQQSIPAGVTASFAAASLTITSA